MANLPKELAQLEFGKSLAESLASIGRSIGEADRQAHADEIVKSIFSSMDIANPESFKSPTMYEAISRLSRTPEGQRSLGNIGALMKMAQDASQESRARSAEERAKAGEERAKAAERRAEAAAARGGTQIVGTAETGYKNVIWNEDTRTWEPGEFVLPGRPNVNFIKAEIPGTRRTVNVNGYQQEVWDWGYKDEKSGNWAKEPDGSYTKAGSSEVNLSSSRSKKDLESAGITVQVPTIIPGSAFGEKFGRIVYKTYSKGDMQTVNKGVQSQKIAIEAALKEYATEFGLDMEKASKSKYTSDELNELMEQIEDKRSSEEADYVANLIKAYISIRETESTLNAFGAGVGDVKASNASPDSSNRSNPSVNLTEKELKDLGWAKANVNSSNEDDAALARRILKSLKARGVNVD